MRLTVLLAVGILSACSGETRRETAPIVQFERSSADTVQHGKRIATILGCVGCHGQKLTGNDWSEPGFGQLWSANLTRAVAGYDDQQLATVITSGRRADRALWGMPSHLFTKLTAEDMLSNTLIDGIIKEPIGGAQTEPEEMFKTVKDEINKHLAELSVIPEDELVRQRIDKFCSMGVYEEVKQAPLEVNE